MSNYKVDLTIFMGLSFGWSQTMAMEMTDVGSRRAHLADSLGPFVGTMVFILYEISHRWGITIPRKV